MTPLSAAEGAPSRASAKLLVVGYPRGGTSLFAQYLVSLGLKTVTDPRQSADYPAGFMEHLPALLFTKACERLRGPRDRLTDDSLIRNDFLDIPAMRAMFEEAYRVFEEPGVDFLKLPDHALALDFIYTRFPNVRFLGVWREPRAAIMSFYRREFGRFPGPRGMFYAIGTWNMYARRLIDFRTRHPEAIDLISIDDLIVGNRSLHALLAGRGWTGTRDHGIREILRKEWLVAPGIVGRSLPLFERIIRGVAPSRLDDFFRTDMHMQHIRSLSV